MGTAITLSAPSKKGTKVNVQGYEMQERGSSSRADSQATRGWAPRSASPDEAPPMGIPFVDAEAPPERKLSAYRRILARAANSGRAQPKRRLRAGSTRSIALFSLGALAGLVVQLFVDFGQVSKFAVDAMANMADTSLPHVSLSSVQDTTQYDKIEKFWQTISKDGKAKGLPDAPSSMAHRFESKRWYSEKLHPIALGLRATWIRVLSGFMKDIPIADFSEDDIARHYHANENDVQSNCVLVRIASGRATFTKTFADTRHGRYPSLVYIIQEVLSENPDLDDTTFLVMLNDGHMPHVPTFGAARHWDSWTRMIPAPLGNIRGEAEGWGTPLDGWDAYIAETIKDKRVDYPWASKAGRAVFRGALQMQTHKLGSCNAQNKGRCARATRWDQVNRGVMYRRAAARPDLFDIAFTRVRARSGAPPLQLAGAPAEGAGLRFADHMRFKYVLCVGSNQDWAERARSLLFMNSALVLHSAETKEFFTPLLMPWRHYVPTNVHMTDLARNVAWAAAHDADARDIAAAANRLADRYLSERAMRAYWAIALREHATRQRLAVSPSA